MISIEISTQMGEEMVINWWEKSDKEFMQSPTFQPPTYVQDILDYMSSFLGQKFNMKTGIWEDKK